MTVSKLPTSPAMTQMRELVAQLGTQQLVRIAEEIEDNENRTDEERIIYAVACTTLCKRLDVAVSDMLAFSLGPAAYLGVRAAFEDVP